MRDRGAVISRSRNGLILRLLTATVMMSAARPAGGHSRGRDVPVAIKGHIGQVAYQSPHRPGIGRVGHQRRRHGRLKSVVLALSRG